MVIYLSKREEAESLVSNSLLDINGESIYTRVYKK